MTGNPRLLCLMQLPPPVHGAAVMNAHVARSQLLSTQFEIEVIRLRFADTILEVNQVTIRKLLRAAGVGLRLGWALLARRPNAVYFTLAPFGAAFYRDCGYVALMKMFRVKRVYHMHGKGIAKHLGVSWRRTIYRWAFRDAWVIHLSPSLTADVAGLVETDQILIVPNGVPDLEEAPPRTQHERPRVLFLSNMAEEKGPLVLLDALAMLHRRGVAFEATFAGAPFGTCVQAFHARVARLGLDRCVSYVGPVYEAAKEDLYRRADVFAFPTVNDAFPLVVLEAMQHGLPVVTTREGALPDIVENGDTGFLVGRHDARSVADSLEALLCSPALRERMGASGRARFLDRFTLDCFERQLGAALHLIVSDTGVS